MRLDQLPLVLSVEEFASATRIGRGTAYEAVRTGQIRSIRIGRRVLIPRAVLLDLLGETPILEKREPDLRRAQDSRAIRNDDDSTAD